MITRRTFIGTLAGSLLAARLAAEAQQASKPYRIGVLSQNPAQTLDAFKGRLTELGYVEGRDVVFDVRAAQRADALEAAARNLVNAGVTIIVTIATPPTVAAKRVTSTVPIVMVGAGDPVGAGLVKALGRPGGNVTGSSVMTPDLAVKWLELLKETTPGLSRAAVIMFPDNPVHRTYWREAQPAAQGLGIVLRSIEVKDGRDLEAVFRGSTGDGALLLLPEERNAPYRERLAALAIEARVPAIQLFREFAMVGFLMTYGPNWRDTFARAALYVDKVLRGAKPADLPVEQPTKFELIINLKTAKALGLTIPQSLLLRADEVIE